MISWPDGLKTKGLTGIKPVSPFFGLATPSCLVPSGQQKFEDWRASLRLA